VLVDVARVVTRQPPAIEQTWGPKRITAPEPERQDAAQELSDRWSPRWLLRFSLRPHWRDGCIPAAIDDAIAEAAYARAAEEIAEQDVVPGTAWTAHALRHCRLDATDAEFGVLVRWIVSRLPLSGIHRSFGRPDSPEGRRDGAVAMEPRQAPAACRSCHSMRWFRARNAGEPSRQLAGHLSAHLVFWTELRAAPAAREWRLAWPQVPIVCFRVWCHHQVAGCPLCAISRHMVLGPKAAVSRRLPRRSGII